MKILYLSTSDIKGGAARGAYRLHRGFLQNGIDSKLLVSRKYSDDHTVIGPQTKIKKAITFLRPQLGHAILKLQRTSNGVCHSVNILPSGLHKYINNSDANIVMLHWVGGEMLSIAEIGKINKPIVWRLADQWAFCGTEHYTLLGQEKRFTEGYNALNRLGDDKGFDIDKWTWQRKVTHWYNKPMTIVSGSHWLADCAKSSYLFKNKNVKVIPSGLDMDIYKPLPKATARQILNLPPDKKFVLFGSMFAASDSRKGFHLLLSALQTLSKNITSEVEAIIFGASEPESPPDFGIPSRYLSTLQDDYSLVLAYSAADVFVLPTMQDNLPYTIIESMACGTPCVSFAVGGVPDIIDHKVNGYLAEPFDTEDLSRGIQSILENKTWCEGIAEKCRRKALDEYDVNIQVRRYLELFDDIL
ncbi:MAG: glycosyltransferase [Candidatus Electrothrix sp. AW3_4]|nr:glycosyltransferase [Candidatus Electrothrix gigas]